MRHKAKDGAAEGSKKLIARKDGLQAGIESNKKVEKGGAQERERRGSKEQPEMTSTKAPATASPCSRATSDK